MIQIKDSEKVVFMQKGSVMMDFDNDSARSILCQAMMDETIRLRDCRRQRERDSIRKFLIWSFQELSSGDTDQQKIADLEKQIQSQQEEIDLLIEFCNTGKVPERLRAEFF